MQQTKQPELISFGIAVRKYRLEKSLSQEELASLSELDRTYIGGVERGERNVSLLNIHKIAKALGTTPDFLLKESAE